MEVFIEADKQIFPFRMALQKEKKNKQNPFLNIFLNEKTKEFSYEILKVNHGTVYVMN